MSETKSDPIYLATTSFYTKVGATDVFVEQGSRWASSSGLPHPGDDRWVLAENVTDADVQAARLRLAQDVEAAAEHREQMWAKGDEEKRRRGLAALLGR